MTKTLIRKMYFYPDKFNDVISISITGKYLLPHLMFRLELSIAEKC